MSYSDFTLDSLRRVFDLSFREDSLFKTTGALEPSAWLREALDKGQELALFSEKARSEFIVAPVLMACRDMFHKEFHIFSGVRLDMDPEKGLKGECDFILARAPSTYVLQSPLLVVLEAKKNDVEEGLGQCAAQMYALRLFNERDGNPHPVLYGCVTTGEAWQFLKLADRQVTIDTTRYYINQLGTILWVLAEIMKTVLGKPASDAA